MNFPLPADLKFKDENERIATMESYAQQKDQNPAEYDRIMGAPVEVPDPPAATEDVESEEFGGSDAGAPAAHAQPAPAQLAPTPAPASGLPTPPPPAAQPGAPQPPAQPAKPRRWVIEEKDIPQDTYFDAKEQKVRPFITHTKPEDVFKTLIHGQKRIHYLEDVLLPQERRAAEDAAKAASQAEIDRLKAENEALKRGQTQTPAAPQPGSQPAAGTPPAAAAPAPVPAGQLGESTAKLRAAMAALKGVDRQNAIEHTDKIMDALLASVDHIDNLTAHTTQIQRDAGEIGNRLQKTEAERAAEMQRGEQQRKIDDARKAWEMSCQLVDSFAQTSPDFKQEYGTIDQPFKEMTGEAIGFHASLASLMFQKHPNQINEQEQMAASMAYLRGDEKLLQAAQQYGINEPRNYRAWLELDQIDAMRTGMIRDPQTKNWVQTFDPVTRQPVRLGNMETSYGRYLDVSGKRQKRQQDLLNRQADNLASAITRRDSGIVSMDPNRLGSEGGGNELSEQQAVEILEAAGEGGGDRAVADYMRTGNRERIDRINQALARMGQQPIPLPDISVPTRKK